MATDVLTAIQQFVESLLSNHDTAVQYASDPAGTLAAHGITDHNLAGVDMRQVVSRAAQAPTVPEHTRVALQSYSSGGGQQVANFSPPPPVHYGHTTVDQVQQHLNYVTNVSYQDDHSVTENFDNSTHIDQSQHLSNSGILIGDTSFDNHSANATGDGAAANSGDHGIANTGDGAANNTGSHGAAVSGNGNVVGTGNGDVTGATGNGSQAVSNSNIGQNANGNGNVQALGSGPVTANTGNNAGGVIAGGDVNHTVVGNGNNTVDLHGPNNGNIGFGSGDQTNVHTGGSGNGPVTVAGGHGDATNISGNNVSGGSSIAGGHSVASGFEDNSVHTNVDVTDVHAYHSDVNTAQDGSEADQHLHQQSHYDAPQHPVVLEDTSHLDPMHHDLALHP
jgi:hypothetical protein